MHRATIEPPNPLLIHPARIQALANAYILVVDDDRIVRNLLLMMLQKAGFTDLAEAKSGEIALEMIPQRPPDLMLLDLFMPGMDGLEVCKKIGDMELENPPAILIQTGSNDDKHVLKAFHNGAVDYISKPVRDVQLVTRCMIHLERRNLEFQLASQRNRMRDELDEAAQIQQDLLPSKAVLNDIADAIHIDIASHVTFSSELGGDIWGIKQISRHHTCLYTVDITGHGLKSALHTFRIHASIQDSTAMRSNPSGMLSTLNSKLHGVIPTGQFATMCYMLLDTELRTLTYSTAAAPLPMIIRQNGERVTLEGGGLPLSCAAGSHYDQQQVSLMSGDKILIYSDALFEVIPDMTEEFVRQIIHQEQGSAQDIIDGLMVEILHRLGNATIQDDLTLVAIKIP